MSQGGRGRGELRPFLHETLIHIPTHNTPFIQCSVHTGRSSKFLAIGDQQGNSTCYALQLILLLPFTPSIGHTHKAMPIP